MDPVSIEDLIQKFIVPIYIFVLIVKFSSEAVAYFSEVVLSAFVFENINPDMKGASAFFKDLINHRKKETEE